MLEKNIRLILSILITSIIMVALQYYFIGASERFSRLSGGFFSNLFRCMIIVIIMIAIPYLVIFRLLLKTRKIGVIYQSIIIGITSALLMFGLELLVPFRQNIDYLRIIIVLLPGCLFPFTTHFFESKMLSKPGKDSGVSK